jgi:hypothetical protein
MYVYVRLPENEYTFVTGQKMNKKTLKDFKLADLTNIFLYRYTDL